MNTRIPDSFVNWASEAFLLLTLSLILGYVITDLVWPTNQQKIKLNFVMLNVQCLEFDEDEEETDSDGDIDDTSTTEDWASEL